MRANRLSFQILTVILVGVLIFSFLLGIGFGSSHIELKTVYRCVVNNLFSQEIYPITWDDTTQIIIWEVRVPRVFLAIISGSGLALCGILMQCITRNPISEPYILGISSGATTGAVFIMLTGNFLSITGIATGAFVGAMICGIIVFLLGTQWGKNISTTRLILTGLAVSTVFSSFTNLMVYSAKNSNQVRSAVFWSLGSLGRADWNELWIPTIILILISIISLMNAKTLDIMILGDSIAKVMGVETGTIKALIIFSSVLLTAVLVSITGTIGFIGFIIPHFSRFLVGNNHRKLIVISIILGGIFLIWCDMIARCTISPKEIPIGIITSILGGPIFLVMLSKKGYTFGGNNDRD